MSDKLVGALGEREMFGIIYVATNKTNGLEYVGQTVNTLNHRIGKHIQEAKTGRSRPFMKALVEFGRTGFRWREIAKAYSADELDELEVYFISERDTIWPNGYNLHEGGNMSMTSHPETRQKLREINSGPGNPMFGKRGHLNPLFGTKWPAERERLCGENNHRFGTQNHKLQEINKERSGEKHHWFGKGGQNGATQTEEHKRRRVLSWRSTWENMSQERKQELATNRVYTPNGLAAIAASSAKEWLIIRPDGSRQIVTNLKAFCIEQNLRYVAMQRVSRGEVRKHRGYQCFRNNEAGIALSMIHAKNKPRQRWLITTPKGEHIETDTLEAFCIKHGICYQNLLNVAAGRRAHAQGYRCKKL